MLKPEWCFHHRVSCAKVWGRGTKETEDEIIKLLDRPYIKGLSLLGGEPFEPANQKELVNLLRRTKQ